MIEQTIANWHLHLKGELEGGLDVLLDDDVVFYSPVQYAPKKGKDITKFFLTAAIKTLLAGRNESNESKFKYSKQLLAGNQAILEFESEIEEKYINGVDIITCNDEGKIIEFRVMVRPLQAVNLLQQQMAAMLEKMQAK